MGQIARDQRKSHDEFHNCYYQISITYCGNRIEEDNLRETCSTRRALRNAYTV
jgi:hypothetical protein